MNPRIKDITGERFGKLTVLSFSHINKKDNWAYWDCICDCGNKRVACGTRLRNGELKSCGCLSKSFSEQWIRNLSSSHRGIKPTEETKKKMSKSQMGREVTELTRKKIGDAQRGEKNHRWGKEWSIEDRLYRAEIHRGEKSHLWKGGITKENHRIRGSVDSKIWRESVFKRDDYTCQECNIRGTTLNAHHIKEFSNNIELRFDVINGITLCVPCHRRIHGWNTKVPSPCVGV